MAKWIETLTSIDFGDKNIDGTLEDNDKEEIMRYLRELQQQVENNSWPRQTRRHINCDCECGKHSCLLNEYFSKNFVYTERQFRRRFQMKKQWFLRIVDALNNHYSCL